MPFIPSASQISIQGITAFGLSLVDDADAVAARQTLAADPAYPLTYKSTYFYAAKHATTGNANQSLTQDRMYLFPFVPVRTHTFDRISVYQAADASATSVGRLGIYASDATGLPSGAPVVDGGTFDAASGGASRKDVTISQSLTGGVIYWVAFVQQVAGGGLFYGQGAFSAGPDSFGTSNFDANQSGWNQETVTGALPSIGAIGTNGAVVCPWLALRAT